MGAWGISIFENDSALDWLQDFEDDFSLDTIIEIVKSINDEDGYIDIDDCMALLVCAEIVAMKLGFPSEDFPDEFDFSNSIVLGSEDLNQLVVAIKKVCDESISEYVGLYGEEDTVVYKNDILQRLQFL